MNIVLMANGTSENHGCEAITRTTVKLLEPICEKIYCSTTNLSYEKELPSYCEWVEYSYYRKPTLVNRVISKAERVLLKTNKYAESKPWLKNMDEVFDESQLALSVGGDNYCNGSYEWLYSVHDSAVQRGLKTVLWGASIDESSLKNQKMREDFLKFDLLCMRESVSQKIALQFHPNVKLYPDPAFLLDSIQLSWPGYAEDNVPEFIGFNASPTTIACEQKPGLLMENYDCALADILENTNYHVALIPHVIYHQKYGDYEVLKQLYEKYKETKRVVLIGDNNCSVLKGYIGRCKVFVTARTHASIAAYSLCVPTLVLGYSSKARGIAADLFGTEEHYVLPVQSIRENEELKHGVQWLLHNEQKIRQHLQSVMPDYIYQAGLAADALEIFR